MKIMKWQQIVRDNVYACISGSYKEGVTDLNTLGNLAALRIDRKTNTPPVRKLPRLTYSQKRAVQKFYSPYVLFLTKRYHRLYTAITGRFYPQYIPEELYFMWIDRYFCDRDEARYLDNKCYYYRLFSNVKQPKLVAMRIGSTWLDGGLNPVNGRQVLSLVGNEPEVVVKRALNSQGGYGVHFISGGHLASDFRKTIHSIHGDVVVQRPLKQHPQLAKLHPQSVNTIRMVSLLTKDKVKIYAAALKIGTGDSRTDNASQNGIYCGLKPDGSLRDYGILDNGTAVTRHPDLGYSFSGNQVPHFGKALALVKKAHAFLGHFRLVSWDVTIDEQGEAVLIEANLTLGGINDVQMSCGPLFGKDTKKVLDEVMKGRRKVTTLL